MNAHYRKYHARILQGCSLCHIAERRGQECPINRLVNGAPSDKEDVEERDSSPEINLDPGYQTATSLPIGKADLDESELFPQDQGAQTPANPESSLAPEDRLPVLAVPFDAHEDVFEAGAAQVEATPAVKHTANVPDDRECASPSAASDCSGSWSEVSSVRSEDFDVAVEIMGEFSESEGVGAGRDNDAVETNSESLGKVALAQSANNQSAPERDLPREEPPATQAASQTPLATSRVALTCKACMGNPVTPVVTMCGHTFCHGCILKALASTLACPACYRPILVKLEV